MKSDIDPVQMAIPFFVIAIVLEVILARMGKAKANYETKDTATSLAMGLKHHRRSVHRRGGVRRRPVGL